MSTEAGSESAYESPTISSDFFQGDIRRGLERMRLRLLDLTSRNRLLNFRYTKKSSLRVVDELPDQLFAVLSEGKTVRFKPVPRPRGLAVPMSDDEEQIEIGGGKAGQYSTHSDYPTAKEEAERLGIGVDFELPFPSDVRVQDNRYNDRAIQTLHYPEELEAILRTISSSARLAIEETGTNMLYLVAGLLEWYESVDSRQARLAPLLLLPVNLKREDPDDASRTYSYAVQHSGEDVLTNISLQERLRRDFGLELPELGEEDTPERYFEKLKPLLVKDERWCMRRHMTLTLLSFGKLLMYRDLDPKNWPAGRGPADHARIKEFFGGVQHEGVAIAEEYRLDELPTKGRVPAVVDDADSSQHSALVDAVEGRNLVIAGPPGTGKSQTITNLIAATLAQGKRVLFVSEKLAALEVVRHRLDKLGLGAFCLELHSHKAHKRRLLDDIDERIKLHRQFRDPALLDEKLRMLDGDRRVLTEYVELVNQPFGRREQTLYDVIWAARRKRKALRFDPGLIDQVLLPNAEDLSAQAVAERMSGVAQYLTHLQEVLHDAPKVMEHPWYGLRNTALTFVDEQPLVGSLKEFLAAAQSLAESAADINVMVGETWLPSSMAEISTITKVIRELPSDPPDVDAVLLPRLRVGDLRKDLTNFAQQVRRFRAILEKIIRLAGAPPALGPAEITRAAGLLDRATEVVPGASVIEDIDCAAALAASCATAIGAGLTSIQTLSEWVEDEVPRTAMGLALAESALQVLSRCPRAELRYRHAELEVEGASAVLSEANREAEVLRKKREQLSTQFDLSLTPSIADLRRSLMTAANARWWSVFSPNFRATRRAFAGVARQQQKPSREEMASGWRRILEFAVSKEDFEANKAYRRVAGAHFLGIDTPWDALRRIADWRVSTLETLSFGAASGKRLANALWRCTPEQIKGLTDTEGDHAKISRPCRAAIESIDKALPVYWPLRQRDQHQDLASLAKELDNHGHTAATVYRELASLGIPARLRLSDRQEFVQSLTELESVNRLVQSANGVAVALGDAFVGPATDLERIGRTIALYDTFVSSRLPVPLIDWLLTPQAVERLAQLHLSRAQLDERCKSLTASWASFQRIGAVDVLLWAGAKDIGAARIEDVVSRSKRALASPEALPGWLDYLRAREALVAVKLQPLADLAELSKVEPGDLGSACDYVISNSMVQQAFQKHPYLARFSGLSHEQIRRRFAKLDRETMELQRMRTAYATDHRPIPMGNGSGPVVTHTELHLLEREIEKQKRHIPIRQLLLRGGRALQALKPCFMMGPLSVAQYLAPAALEFDLVVMDEASQLKPEDALGAITRAKQVVVVGDRMQLPPTSFFDRIGDDDEEDSEEAAASADALTDAESILDVASVIYKPIRMLRWHYRSRHGSLIAFSNKEFYKNQLIAFPSPIAKSKAFGVKLVHVRDGVYADRRNLIEAKRVVTTALRHMRNRGKESLGIVTLNSTQRELVEGLFEQQIKADPVAQRYVESRADGLEPFFIKNLENVQGDERDVIYISVTYGRSPSGHVYQRFGPINGPTGHRRLNVLFTRARRRVVLFSSMLAEDIQAAPTSSWGARALKGYLQFAQTGVLEQASLSGREPDSDFEIEVAEALRERGLETVAQVGVAGYYIDLAVKHPVKADTFVLGIECDGKTYHSAITARDRDRLRQSVLEDLGWRIHRIWSTDWFKASAREVDRIVARVEDLLREETQADALLGSESPVGKDATEDSLEQPEDTNTNASEDGWRSEIEVQPLSADEVREALQALRKEIERELPDGDTKTGVLRDEMIELLLRSKPRSKDDWLRKVPIELRLNTDGDQLQKYLGRILEITSRMAP